MDISAETTCNFAHLTDVGCVRDLNEDSLFCGDALWLIADGMGGHACGEVASAIAAESIAEVYQQTGSLSEAIQCAHHRIIEAAQDGTGQTGMGTTVVAMTSGQSDYEIAWVGDSRAYLWDGRRGRLSQLTEDHSLIVRLVNSGLISAEEAKSHPQRHMITQCLGSVEIESVQVDSYHGQWQPHQSILLCSDGLSDDVSETEITQILKEETDHQEKLSRLVEAAKLAGGKDNISLILVDSPLAATQSLWNKLKSLIGV